MDVEVPPVSLHYNRPWRCLKHNANLENCLEQTSGVLETSVKTIKNHLEEYQLDALAVNYRVTYNYDNEIDTHCPGPEASNDVLLGMLYDDIDLVITQSNSDPNNQEVVLVKINTYTGEPAIKWPKKSTEYDVIGMHWACVLFERQTKLKVVGLQIFHVCLSTGDLCVEQITDVLSSSLTRLNKIQYSIVGSTVDVLGKVNTQHLLPHPL